MPTLEPEMVPRGESENKNMVIIKIIEFSEIGVNY